MKKLLALLMIAALAVTLFACTVQEPIIAVDPTASSDEITGIRESFDKASAYIEANVDTTDAEVQTDEEDESYLSKVWFIPEGTGSDEFSMDIAVEGNTITLGETTVKELESFGMDIEKLVETVQPDEMIGVQLSKDNRFFSLTAGTPATEAAALDDCIIKEASGTYNEYTLAFSYSGLDEKATLKDVIDTLGVPNSSINLSGDTSGTSIELSYYKKTEKDGVYTDNNLSVYLSYDAAGDTAVLSSIHLSCNSYTEDNAA